MNKLIVYNNLSKKKEVFEPLDPSNIKIYTCGPTVYDHSHIGHARSAITWDFIVRFLRFAGYKVSWTRNITDIDDKIINKAKELNLPPQTIARIYTKSFYEDMIALNVDWPDFEPRATQYIYQMIDFISKLIKNNCAYTVDNDVYFSVQSFKDYGKLKGQSINDLVKGYSRIEPNPKKRHQLDFALWKGVKEPSEYGFNSPWGVGRPGWHLECSCMNYSIFGTTIDIHGGGDDLIFPHHENEIAQSEALTSKPFAKYWIHNGMIMVDSKKMSKSEGNFITIKDALKTTTSNALRLFILNSHYKMPVNFTNEAIVSAQNSVNRLIEALEDYESEINLLSTYDKLNNKYVNDFMQSMQEDFNTPQALSILFKLADEINTETNPRNKLELQSTLFLLGNVLGLKLTRKNIINFEKAENNHSSNEWGNHIFAFSKLLRKLIEWRSDCKIKKDYLTADKIRELLNESKIEIKDLPDGQFKYKIKN